MHKKRGLCSLLILSLFASSSSFATDKRPAGISLLSGADSLDLGVWGQAAYSAERIPGVFNNNFSVRQARVNLRGRLHNWGYKIDGGFVDNKAALVEGWVSLNKWSFFQMKLGKFKAEFSSEVLTDTRWLPFLNLGVGQNNLAPFAPLGFMIFGDFADGRVHYAASVINDRRQNQTNLDNQTAFTARMAFQPFKTMSWEVEQLRFSGAGLLAREDRGLTGDIFKTASGRTFLRAAPTVEQHGIYLGYDANINWILGPVQMDAELVGAARYGVGTAMATISNIALSTDVSWLMTGEEQPYNDAVIPTHPTAHEGGVGAWELSARLEGMMTNTVSFSSDMFSGTPLMWSVTGGLNWYPNQHVKITTDVSYSRFKNSNVGFSSLLPVSSCLGMLQAQFNL